MAVREGSKVFIGGERRPANRAKVLAVFGDGSLTVSSGGTIGRVGPGDYEEIVEAAPEPVQPAARPSTKSTQTKSKAKAPRQRSTGKGK